MRAKAQPIKILVVDDFEPFRGLICSILRKKTDLQIVIEQASDGLEGVQKARELRPDLILLDIGLPKLTGTDAARQMRNLTPHSKIVCVSQESDADLVREMLRLGASGYVHKSRTREDLVLAIETVLMGKRFVSSTIQGFQIETNDCASNSLRS